MVSVPVAGSLPSTKLGAIKSSCFAHKKSSMKMAVTLIKMPTNIVIGTRIAGAYSHQGIGGRFHVSHILDVVIEVASGLWVRREPFLLSIVTTLTQSVFIVI